jgi:SAM-dependent methyltransferase
MEIIRDASVAQLKEDQARWDERYRENHPAARLLPDPWVQEQARWLTGGRALDVACGRGRHTLWLARMGYQVDAVDISLVGLRGLADRIEAEGLADRVQLVQADLEVWRPRPNTYDLILVTRYFNRELLATFGEALRPGGMVLYRTFHTDWLKIHPEFTADYMLQPGEFTTLFADWDWLAYEERRLPPGGDDRDDCTAAILARKH